MHVGSACNIHVVQVLEYMHVGRACNIHVVQVLEYTCMLVVHVTCMLYEC